MKHLNSVGFCFLLIGISGVAESYGFNRSFAIGISLIIAGGLMMYAGEICDDAENCRRNNNIDSNIMDRLHFLCNK